MKSSDFQQQRLPSKYQVMTDQKIK